MASTPLMSQHYNSHSNAFSPNVPIYNPNISPIGADGLADSQVTINPVLNGNPSPAAISRNIINSDIATTFTTVANNVDRNGRSEETSAANTHYLRLIVAERELNNKLQEEAQHRNGGRPVPLR